MLHEVTGKNPFCGPCALSSLTGLPTEIHVLPLRQFDGSRMGQKASCNGMKHALARSGMIVRQEATENVNLSDWCEAHDEEEGNWLLEIKRDIESHWIASCGKMVCDNGHKKPVEYTELNWDPVVLKAYSVKKFEGQTAA